MDKPQPPQLKEVVSVTSVDTKRASLLENGTSHAVSVYYLKKKVGEPLIYVERHNNLIPCRGIGAMKFALDCVRDTLFAVGFRPAEVDTKKTKRGAWVSTKELWTKED